MSANFICLGVFAAAFLLSWLKRKLLKMARQGTVLCLALPAGKTENRPLLSCHAISGEQQESQRTVSSYHVEDKTENRPLS